MLTDPFKDSVFDIKMTFAVFSDIHSNLEALETAVTHARGRGILRFMVLGDTVGYGANPNECLEWVMEHADLNILGNHEKALIEPGIKKNFNRYAWEAIEWTAGVLKESLLNQIQEMPTVRIKDQITFAHGSPAEPEAFHYLLAYDDTEPSFSKMETEICFVGHTHIPACFCGQTRSTEYLLPGVRKIGAGERLIFNPGSVGQPRDHDPRLSYGIYDSDARTFEIVRLVYDNQKTASKIRRAGLPGYLADRLL